jgi:NAD(P)-dependent dehydrogenase (short-subunit alcohol dehydrogenase family)
MSAQMMLNKVALVTGAGSGIGRATAILLAQEGARVIVTNRSAEKGLRTVEAIREFGGEAEFVPIDIGSEEQIIAGVAFAVDTYGRLDCAVNNAAVEQNEWAFTADTSTATIASQLDTNLRGTLLCMKYEIQAILKGSTGGAIVNVTSTAGLRPSPTAIAYGAAKAGIQQASRVAALEYGSTPNGTIRVNAVAPGATNTEFLKMALEQSPEAVAANIAATPMKRVSESEEVAEACVWLCSDRSSYVTGQILAVDGGYTVA